jgi:hypothetical protein
VLSIGAREVLVEKSMERLWDQKLKSPFIVIVVWSVRLLSKCSGKITTQQQSCRVEYLKQSGVTNLDQETMYKDARPCERVILGEQKK